MIKTDRHGNGTPAASASRISAVADASDRAIRRGGGHLPRGQRRRLRACPHRTLDDGLALANAELLVI